VTQRVLATGTGPQAAPELLDAGALLAATHAALADTSHRSSLAKPTDTPLTACESISPRTCGAWFDSPEGIGASCSHHLTGSFGVDTWT
jgi:hypothetical protein